LLNKKVWAVVGGKGGTGKSMLAAAMGAHLADLGFNVVLFDADLSNANLHTFFGMERPALTISEFIERREESMDRVAVDTGIANLRLISGAVAPDEAAHVRYQQKMRIIRRLAGIQADVVLLDVPSGAGLDQAELFGASDLGAVVTVPEPTAMENTYRLLRMLYFHRVREIQGFRKFESSLPAEITNGHVSPVSFLREVEKTDLAWAERIKEYMREFAPGIVVNMARSDKDRELGRGVQVVCRRYFGIEVPFLGAVEYDEVVPESVKNKKPVILAFPHSRPGRSIRRVAENMISLARRSV